MARHEQREAPAFEARASGRTEVFLGARCRESSWIVRRVELQDLSEGGCCIAGGGEGLSEGQEVQIRIASLGSHSGTIRWCDGGKAGVAFNPPLSADTVAQIGQGFAKARPRVLDIRRKG